MSDPLETNTPWAFDAQSRAWTRCHGLTVLVVALDADGAVSRVEVTRKARTEVAVATWASTAWMDADAAMARADLIAVAVTPVPVTIAPVEPVAPVAPVTPVAPVEPVEEARSPAVPPVAPGARRRPQ